MPATTDPAPSAANKPPLLWLLPSGGQTQARAHRFPYRTSATHRRAGDSACKTQTRSRMPVLRRRNENHRQHPATVATWSSPSSSKTKMRLTPHHPIKALPGFFCYFGKGHDGSCPRHGNFADFTSLVLQKCHVLPYVSFKSGNVMLHGRLAKPAQPPLRVVRLRMRQTQNA